MFIPQDSQAVLPSLFNTRPSIIPIPSLSTDKPSGISFDISGVFGLVAGDDGVASMATAYLYRGRRWLGWYNTPGSSQIAKQLSSLAKSATGKLSKTPLSKSVDIDPAILFEPKRHTGPRFRAAHSGTVIEETGYLATLLMKECAAYGPEGRVISGRRTQPVTVTIAELGQAPASEMRPAYNSMFNLLLSSLPVAVSIGACAVCAAYEDWCASSLILVGIVASGVSTLALGSADFVFTHPEPAKGSPAGDGILSSDRDIVLLKGTEGAVNSITRGSFSLRFSGMGHCHLIRWCSFLFYIQLLAQLLFIPQASLFGQVMFLASLGVSALHNTWFSSLDREKIHRKLLFERVLDNPTVEKYTLGTRTSAVVFMLLTLHPSDPTALLNELLPNDTKVWKQWKATILEQLRQPRDKFFLSESTLGKVEGFTQQEQDLLYTLYDDARSAYGGYRDYLLAYSL